MKQLLISRGWYMSGTCNCGGSYNEDYKHRDIEMVTVRITPSYNRYVISKYDRQIKRGNGGLEQALNDLNNVESL
jgi:hypothetical protein